MRSDMFEVIIERPRTGGRGLDWRKGRQKQMARLHPELSPRREPMSIGRGTKHLNENLAPLERFLRRSVGRPWNAVHAEICERIAARSAVQKHVLDHVKQMVETSPVLIDGVPHDPIAAGPRRDRYLPICSGRASAFYVCPRTGILRLGRRVPRRADKTPPPSPAVRVIDDLTELRRIEGVWYRVQLAKVPETHEARAGCYDVVARARLTEPRVLDWRGALWQAHGRRDRYAVAKRQISKRELRAHGLA